MMHRPRVLITRAPHQGSELAGYLRALGVDPILIPAIETIPPASYAALDNSLPVLNTFDWLLFTSANAVDAFAARTEGHPPAELPRIAAIGPATARALGNLGLTPDLVPPQAVAESLADALLAQMRPGARFLLIRAEDAREALPETLRAAGAEVTIAPAYRTVIPAGSIDLLRECLADPALFPDAITFTSSSTARNLLALCEAAGVPLPESALRVSIGPITSETLRLLGIPPHAEASEATVLALANTVLEALHHRR